MTRAELNTLITLLEKYEKEANKKGLSMEAIEKATRRVKLFQNEMLDNGFGPKTDKITT
jgi:hypothetical protein